MRLGKGGRVLAVFAVGLLGWGYVAYRQFTREEALRESDVRLSETKELKDPERPPRPVTRIGGVVMPENVSEITPSTMDAILDVQDFDAADSQGE